VHRAAALLDETIERVRIRAGTVDSVDVAVLAALNIANSLVSERDGRASGASDARVSDLVALIEDALAPPRGASA
jgi:cell division protein ZapA (FtsZ GTPase activity inhibitor)